MTNVLVPRLRFNRRRSTKTGHEVVKPSSGRRSQSIPTVRLHGSFQKENNAMNHSIDLSIAVRDLLASDVVTTSRVVCVVYENVTDNESQWRVISQSRPRSLHRDFAFREKFPLIFHFEKLQLIRIDISRYHDGSCASSSDDVIGSCIFKLDELIGSFGLQLRRSLLQFTSIAATLSRTRHSSACVGTIALSAEMPEKEQPIVVQFHGKSLERKDFLWDETAVFFRVFRLEEGKDDDSLLLLYESEAIKNHSHPQWAEFRLSAKDAADNRNRLLEVWVMYRDVDNKEGYIGKFLTTYAKMKYGPGSDNVYSVINEYKQQQKKSYESSGKVELVKFTDVSFYSFLDYIVSGTQLHFDVAVDFSSDEKSEPSDQNRIDHDVQMSVRAVGEIIRDYTPNRLFPAFGLGARVPPTFHEGHEFHLNFSVDASCRGLDGVIEAYKKAQSMVLPSKEVKLAPVINYAIRRSNQSGFRGLHYHVLAILTKGECDDSKEVLQALSNASDAPLSIIFIGIGNSDFSHIAKFASKRKDGKRECVEFVRVADLFDPCDSPCVNRARIAEEALHAVPQHMVTFMHRNNIAAKPPIQVCRSPLFHSSSLIPDRPTEFVFDDSQIQADTSPRLPRPDRRGSDSHCFDAENNLRNCLAVRVPERSHSVLQTSREQYHRRLKERGLGKQLRFARGDLSTVESTLDSNCSAQEI